MMVNPISCVRFTGNAEDMLSRPGAYTRPATDVSTADPAPKAKKSKAGKVILGTLLTAATLLGAAVALKKFLPDTFKVLENLENAKLLDKVKHYVAKTGQWTIDKCSNFGKWAKGLVSRKPEAAA